MKIKIMYGEPVITIPKSGSTYAEMVHGTTCTDIPVAVVCGDKALKVSIPGKTYLGFVAEEAFIPAICPFTTTRDTLHIILDYLVSELCPGVVRVPVKPAVVTDGFEHECTVVYNADDGTMKVDHDGVETELTDLPATIDSRYVDYDYTGLPRECIETLVRLNKFLPQSNNNKH